MHVLGKDGLTHGERRYAIHRVVGTEGAQVQEPNKFDILAYYYHNTGQSIAANTWTSVALNTALEASQFLTFHVGPPAYFTVVEAGIYLLTGNIGYGSTGSTDGFKGIRFYSSVKGAFGGKCHVMHHNSLGRTSYAATSIALPLAAAENIYLQTMQSIQAMTLEGSTIGCGLQIMRIG